MATIDLQNFDCFLKLEDKMNKKAKLDVNCDRLDYITEHMTISKLTVEVPNSLQIRDVNQHDSFL